LFTAMPDEATILDHGRHDIMRAKLEPDAITDAIGMPNRGGHFDSYLTNLRLN